MSIQSDIPSEVNFLRSNNKKYQSEANMINDPLTITTMVVALFTVILVFGIMIYNNFRTKETIRTLTQRTIMMSTNKELRDLCREIMEIDPKACPLLDGNILKKHVNNPEQLKKLLTQQLQGLKKA